MSKFRLLAFSLSLALCGTAPAWADGILLPKHPDQPISSLRQLPNFTIRHHRVQVQIQDQVAKTQVDQVFHNASRHDLEGTYLFPVPSGATLSNFEMEVDGKLQPAELLQAEQARRIYEEIVRQRVDPGLLEYAGQNLFRARVYPIPAGSDKAMKLGYEQVLGRSEQMHHYRYGLSTERFSQQPLQQASVTVDLQTRLPLKNIYSPSHEIAVQRLAENRARITWEATQVKPDTDFELYYSTSEAEIDATLLTYQPPGEDGYFMLLAAPKVNWAQEKTPAKQMTFVVDTSGSMSGNKIEQAREALTYNLQQLEARDRFQLLTFASEVNLLTPKPVSASGPELQRALQHARSLRATGGTDINAALQAALKGQEQGAGVPMILFVTDGDPTVGVTDFEQILKNAQAANQRAARIFVFGVGYDVNIPFLDRLAQQNQGSAEYVRPEENIEVKVSQLFSQISHPILSKLKFSYGTQRVSQVLPRHLPDFFKGSQLLLVGRYQGSGQQTLKLSGELNGQQRHYNFPKQNFAAGLTSYDFLPRLWASRQIGFLLDQIRLQGKKTELVEEVIRLSKAYGIVTEYTSFLVREDVDVRQPAASAPMMEEAQDNLTRSLAADKGSWAISQSRNAANLQQKSAPASGNTYLDAEGREQSLEQIKFVSQRAFYLKKEVWQDSLPADKLPKLAVQRFSPLYFALAQQAGLKQILALGEQVEFVWQGHLIQVLEKGQSELSPALKKQLKL